MLRNDTAMLVLCRSLCEAEAASAAIERLRNAETQQREREIEPDTVERIHTGLSLAPFPQEYRDMLRVWYDHDPSSFVSISAQIEKLNKTAGQMRAMLSKFSARMKRIATPTEIKELRTPLMLLLDISYDESHSSSHKLTSAGRKAVKRYLRLS